MGKLLGNGRTDLLEGFVSSRTNRKFKAFLVRQPDGKIGFELNRALKSLAAPPSKTAAKTATKMAAKGPGKEGRW